MAILVKPSSAPVLFGDLANGEAAQQPVYARIVEHRQASDGLTIDLAAYENEESRRAGAGEIWSDTLHIIGPIGPAIIDRAAVYGIMKAKSVFHELEDV